MSDPTNDQLLTELQQQLATIRDSNSWLNLQMQALAKILQMPANSTMKDLTQLATDRMAELTKLRAQVAPGVKT